jgi:dTDP-glucose 4,6-dehydratase
MKLLVTGGAGFIGSNFVHVVAKDRPNWSILTFDLLTYAGNRANLLDQPNHTFTQGDIADAAAVGDALKGCDLVVHFAAESHVTRSEDNPDRFYHTNVTGTQVVLAAAKAANIPVIHISTDEVYGPIVSGYFKEIDKLSGDGQATSAYAKSKAQADDVATAAMVGQPVIVVRPTNNYGPRQYPEKALARWITNLIDGQLIPLWSPGNQVRDWLFVEDTARGVLFLIEHGQWGEVYNLGMNNDPEVSNKEAAEKLCALMGIDPTLGIQLIPDPRPDHDDRYGVDTSKLAALGFTPRTSFADGLKQTVEWYQANEFWWRPLKAEAESIYEKKETK